MKKKITLGIILFISIYLVSSTIPYYPRESVSTEYQANIANTSFTSDSIGSERVAYIDDKDRKSTRLNSSNIQKSRMPSSA